MRDHVNKHLRRTAAARAYRVPGGARQFIMPAPRITCADGFSLSAQASETTYCSPREDNAFPYRAVEVGYPAARERMLMPYVEDADTPLDTVYGWVPIRIVNKVIAKHGGPSRFRRRWTVPFAGIRKGSVLRAQARRRAFTSGLSK